MASKSAILAVKIIGDADRAISALGKTGLAAGAMGAAVVAGGALAGKALYDVGAVFDGVSDTIAVGTGASGEALEGMVDSAKNVGKQVPVEFDAAGEAIASLNTYLGATGKPLEDMTANVLDASRMLGEDGPANADKFGRAMVQWQRPAEDGADVLDTLFLSTQKYGLGLDAQIGHLNTYGSVLQNAGFTMEEAASLFGQLESGGISVSRIMPGLNKSFRDWASEGKDVQAELLGTVDAIENASSSTEALSIATDVFGAEGAQRLTTAIRSGVFDLEDLSGALDGASGSIAETSAETMSAGEHWQLLVNNLMAAVEPLASVVFDLVGDAFGALADWVQTIDFTPLEEFADMLGEALPGLATGFLDVVDGAQPLSGVLDRVLPALESIGGAVADFLPTLVEFGQGILPHLADAMGSIIDVLLNVAEAVIPAVIEILDTALPIIGNILDAVMPAIMTALETLVPKILEIIPPLQEIITTILDYLGPVIEWLLPLVTDIFGALVTQIEGAIEIIVAVLETVSALLSGDWAGAWEAAGGIVDGVMTFIEGVIDQGMSWIAAFTGDTVDGVRTKMSKGWEAIRTTVSRTVQSMVDRVVGFFTGLRDKISGAIDRIKGTIRTGFENARSTAVNAFSRLVSGVVGKITDLLGRVRRLPSQIKSGLGNLGNLLRSAGRDLIRGMINGIGSMGSALRNRASNLAGSAVSAIKSRLGIASPSRVMREIGTWTGEGLILGIERMQRDAGRAMAGLVTVPDVPEIPLSASTADARRGHGEPVHEGDININITGVIDDVMVRKIEQAIVRAKQRRGSAAGSRLVVA